jgi:parallel beta-helix repeat protein
MQGKIVAVWVSIIMVLSVILVLVEIAPNVEAPTTHYVGGSNPGNYSKIQWAIDNSSDGDTVFVYSGVYEEYIIVNKTLNITGEAKESTIIEGNGTGNLVMISSHWVNITGFTINNSNIGIRMGTTFNLVEDNIISHHYMGIELTGTANNNTFENSSIINNRHSGVYLQGSWDNQFLNNEIINNTNGMLLQGSEDIEISGNNISSIDYGILIYFWSLRNHITNNFIRESKYGVVIEDSHENEIMGNTIVSNDFGVTIVEQTVTMDNLIFGNNFFNNSYHGYDESTMVNYWYNSYPTGGNYWSDYSGVDDYSGPNQNIPGSDGIGDTPYKVDSDDEDKYPLMLPKGNYIFLNHGWNFISIPFIQSETQVGTVLKSITGLYDSVQVYDAGDPLDPWKHIHASKPSHFNDLDAINHKNGFYIHVKNQMGILFEYFGTQPISPQIIPIYQGWNMVGYPSLSFHNRTEGLNNLNFGDDINAIQWYDAGTKSWHYMDQNDTFVPGRGYWFHSKVTLWWEVPL